MHFDQIVRDNVEDLKKYKHTVCLLYSHVVAVQKYFKEQLVVKPRSDSFYDVSLPSSRSRLIESYMKHDSCCPKYHNF